MNDKSVLYIIATPIGNLDDITHRALSTLKAVDIVAAEDTRHSQKLLNHFGISAKLMAYHDHSSSKQVDNLLGMLQKGLSVGLISDAGTPLIADPGYRIVKLARDQGIRVVPIPGVSAPIAALSAAGLATDRFSFEGFLPHKSGPRSTAFELIKHATGTSVFFESPHRIKNAIDDAVAVLGSERSAVLAREITKTYETFLSASLGEIRDALLEDSNQSRGEIVLLIGPNKPEATAEDDEIAPETKRILSLLASDLPTKQAASLASKITGTSKKKLYELALTLKENTSAV